MVQPKKKKEGRRLPTAVKQLRGTARKDRVNKDEPQFDNKGSVPMAPESVQTDDGRKLWYRISMQLFGAGLLFESTYELIERYCITYERIMKMEKMIRDTGEFVVTKNGPRKHPALAIINETFIQWYNLGRELGLGPVSKSKLIANAGNGNQGKNKGKKVSFRQG